MSSKKKDLEIVCNIQWKNKSANGGDKANVIGMYDIPATTLSWEHFKTYLLKNSGISEDYDNVKVSYLTESLSSDEREVPIETQIDFQIALYAFRRKARAGEVIRIFLDRISTQNKMNQFRVNRHSNDAETQFDNTDSTQSAFGLATNLTPNTAPKWFTDYMKTFKKEILKEVNTVVTTSVSCAKSQSNQPPFYHSRKSKADSSKRSRKHPLLHEDKEISKLEQKLENKLEKLEHKSKKIKEKKLALITRSTSDSDAGGHSSSKSCSNVPDDFYEELQMNASPVEHKQSVIPHKNKGEIYKHTWEVINNGSLPWTCETDLRFTWGSKTLRPVEKIVPCPLLNPGEKGSISVLLQVPTVAGPYECYWHFHHKGARFGHWLGCQIIVDPESPFTQSDLEISSYNEWTAPKKIKMEPIQCEITNSVLKPEVPVIQICPQFNPLFSSSISNITKGVGDLQVADDEPQNDKEIIEVNTEQNENEIIISDSDNQSIISICDSNISVNSVGSNEFIVIPMLSCSEVSVNEPEPAELKVTESNDVQPQSIDSLIEENEAQNVVLQESDDNNNTTDGAPADETFVQLIEAPVASSGSQMVIIDNPDDNTDGFAYVVVEGQKLPVPKKFLRKDYLQTAEEAPNPKDVPKSPLLSSSQQKPEEKLNKEDFKSKILPSSPQQKAEEVKVEKEDLSIENNEQISFQSLTESHTQEARKSSPGVPDIVPFYDNLDQTGAQSYVSHCSAAGSCFSEVNNSDQSNSRLFIFPQNCPGYEVVYPINKVGCTYHSTQCLYPTSPNQDTANSPFMNDSSVYNGSESLVGSPTLQCKNVYRNTWAHVPNYQQTSPAMRIPVNSTSPPKTYINQQPTYKQENMSDMFNSSYSQTPPNTVKLENMSRTDPSSPPVHILPETLVTGAVNVASSAINTARSVLNMIVTPKQEPGRWINGHWVATSPETPREANLRVLSEMGFWDRDLNATLLARYNDDLARVITELVQ